MANDKDNIATVTYEKTTEDRFDVKPTEQLKERLATLKESADNLINKHPLHEKLSELDIYKELSELRKNIASRRNFQIERLLEAFPDFEFKGFKSQINEFKLELHIIKNEIRMQKENIKSKRKQAKLDKKNNKD